MPAKGPNSGPQDNENIPITNLNFENLNDIIESGTTTDELSPEDSDHVSYEPDFPNLNSLNSEEFDYYDINKLNSLYSDKHISTNHALTVVHFNIRGLQSNFDNLVLYLSSLSQPFDFICLSETHIHTANADIDDRFNLDGYDKHFVSSSILYGGCLIYAKSIHKVEKIKTLTKTTSSCDYVYVKMPQAIGKKALVIGCYYRHCRSKKADVINFINEFEHSLDTDILRKSKTCIAGDFNLDLCKINRDNDISTYFNCLLANNLVNHILKPTRIQYYANSLQVRSATLIDHISSNFIENKCTAGNLYFSNSDHFGNFVIFEKVFNVKRTPKAPPLRRLYSKIDQNSLVQDINSIDWEGDVCNNELEIEECTKNMIDNIQALCDKHAPLTKCSNRKTKYCNKPWIDKELVKQIMLKNKLYRKMKKNPNENNKLVFSQSRSQVNHSMRIKKKAYFTNYFNTYRTNSKKTWEGLYLAMELTRNRKTIGTHIKDHRTSKILHSPQEIADSFATHFEDVPINVRSKLPTVNPDFRKYLPKALPNSMYFSDTSPLEIFNLINKLKNSSSTGDLPIPNQFLKIINFPISYILSHLINRSLKEGSMPRVLKRGKQTPVFKSGEKTIANHRPITVVNSFAKIFEKVVAQRLIDFIDKYKLLNNRQFGFRKYHNTVHAMINLLDTCLEGLDERLTVGGVFLDISKAFDSVDHSILINKLENYGIRGVVLDWFKSYLCERELYVSVNGVSSSKYFLKYGIPQGSVLGPILFLLYINDVVNSSNKLVFSIFADDTALILKIDREFYDETMRTELSNVMNWFDSNLLLLNVDKTKYIYFGPEYNTIKALHSITPEFMYKKSLGDDFQNPENTDVKYLGVIFDHELTFDKQVNSISMKISRMVGILWKCQELHESAKLTIYHSLVASYLNYGILIWGSQLGKNLAGRFPMDHVPNHLHKLNTAHNKVIRAITRSKKYDKETKVVTHTAPLLKKLGLLRLNDIYYLHLALFAYDCLRSPDLPSLFENYISTHVSVYNNRASIYDVVIPRVHLDSTLRTVKVASSYMWNKLPHDIRASNYSRNLFKNKVKHWLVNQY